eukprot:TRINITY_DN1410_c0_g1_i6.p1 TRINITY_DN1410_c0_g1~~TRINITY_DN1410_c0_g1_i6.p1  ORF type:complete len:296 (-),score=48.59 TRINITY_DN1410_c0_g1_i6:94-981(-)
MIFHKEDMKYLNLTSLLVLWLVSSATSSCTIGFEKCLSSNEYTTCANYTGTPDYGPPQFCPDGLVCSPVGSYIYCVRPVANPPLCPRLVGPFTMDQGPFFQPLPHVDTQFSPSPRYDCTGQDDCNYKSFGPGFAETVQDPSVEGNRLDNLVIDFSSSGCSPSFVQFGLAYDTIFSPVDGKPLLVVRNSNGQVISVQEITVFQGSIFNGALVTYSGSPATSFEVVHDTISALGPRFAFDNLLFCCSSCSRIGDSICVSSTTYSTCANYTGTLNFGPVQSCQPGLSCTPSGNVIYCQ